MNKLKKTLEDLLGSNSLIGRSTYNRPPKNVMNGKVKYTKEGFAYAFGFSESPGSFNYDSQRDEVYLAFGLSAQTHFCFFDYGNDGVVDYAATNKGKNVSAREKLKEDKGAMEDFTGYDSMLLKYKTMTDFEKIYDYWEKNYKEK